MLALYIMHRGNLLDRVLVSADDDQDAVSAWGVGHVGPAQGAHLATAHTGHEQQPGDHGIEATAHGGDLVRLDAAAGGTWRANQSRWPLNRVRINHEVHAGPVRVVETCDQQPVVAVDVRADDFLMVAAVVLSHRTIHCDCNSRSAPKRCNTSVNWL